MPFKRMRLFNAPRDATLGGQFTKLADDQGVAPNTTNDLIRLLEANGINMNQIAKVTAKQMKQRNQDYLLGCKVISDSEESTADEEIDVESLKEEQEEEEEACIFTPQNPEKHAMKRRSSANDDFPEDEAKEQENPFKRRKIEVSKHALCFRSSLTPLDLQHFLMNAKKQQEELNSSGQSADDDSISPDAAEDAIKQLENLTEDEICAVQTLASMKAALRCPEECLENSPKGDSGDEERFGDPPNCGEDDEEWEEEERVQMPRGSFSMSELYSDLAVPFSPESIDKYALKPIKTDAARADQEMKKLCLEIGAEVERFVQTKCVRHIHLLRGSKRRLDF